MMSVSAPLRSHACESEGCRTAHSWAGRATRKLQAIWRTGRGFSASGERSLSADALIAAPSSLANWKESRLGTGEAREISR